MNWRTNTGTCIGKGFVCFALLVLLVLSGCARDRESALRAQLNQWFYLGATNYFESRMRCTGAMISVSVDRPRPALVVQRNLEHVMVAMRSDRIVAIAITGVTPAELTDALLLTGTGAFGRQTLAAGALAGACFDDPEVSAFLHGALTRPGAILAYDRVTEGVMVLDPYRSRLFFVASDVW